MGLFSKIKNKLQDLGKRAFSKKGFYSFLMSGGGILPITHLTSLESEKSFDAWQKVAKGLGNLVSGGYIAQQEANEIMKKNAKEAEKQYEEAQRKAEAEEYRLRNIDEDRRKRLATYGNKTPRTLMGSYLGVTGGANVGKPTLG